MFFLFKSKHPSSFSNNYSLDFYHDISIACFWNLYKWNQGIYIKICFWLFLSILYFWESSLSLCGVVIYFHCCVVYELHNLFYCSQLFEFFQIWADKRNSLFVCVCEREKEKSIGYISKNKTTGPFRIYVYVQL